MRASRLLALMLAIQRDRRTTAAALAEELEVSVRTVHRDVEALQMAGVPLFTARGAGGGIGIVDRWQSPVEALSPDEVGALVIGGPAADLGLGAVLALARSKLRSGLPAHVQHQIDLVGERVLLDTSGWFDATAASEHLATITRAVWESKRLDITYRRGERTVARRLDPLGLVLKAGNWYLVAAHRGQPRTYRASRIESAVVGTVDAERPSGFDLASYWHEAAASFDAEIRRIEVVLTVPTESLDALVRHVPGPLTEESVRRAREATQRSNTGRPPRDAADDPTSRARLDAALHDHPDARGGRPEEHADNVLCNRPDSEPGSGPRVEDRPDHDVDHAHDRREHQPSSRHDHHGAQPTEQTDDRHEDQHGAQPTDQTDDRHGDRHGGLEDEGHLARRSPARPEDRPDAGPDGRVTVRLRMESVQVACHQLCAVPGVEVLEPRELRELMHRLGQVLVRHHGEPVPPWPVGS